MMKKMMKLILVGSMLCFLSVNAFAMQIFVKTLMGKTITLEVVDKTEIGTIKYEVSRLDGVDPRITVLVFDGRQLDDRSSLADYNIQKESTLHLVLNLR